MRAFAALLFILAGCAGAPRISLEAATTPATIARAHATYWDAALAFDFDAATQLAASDAQREYVRALREVAADQLGSASTRLEVLARGDTDVAPRAKALLEAVGADGPFDAALRGARLRERWHFPSAPAVLPFERRSTPTPLLPVALNGRAATLGLDTGAGLTVIGSELADAAGAKRLGARTGASDVHGTDVGVELATVDLDLGGIRIIGHPVIVIDSARLRFRVAGIEIAGFDGVLGWNAIRELRIEIDNRERTVRLSKAAGTLPGAGNLLWVGQPYVRAQAANGLPLTLLLDTGASRTGLAASVATAAGLAQGETRSTLVFGAGGSKRVEVTVFRDAALHVGGAQVRFAELRTIEPRTTGYAVRDGVLGADALVEGKVTMDFSAGEFRLDPGSSPR